MADLAFIDTSGEQHSNGAAIDWHAVKAAGIAGVYVKLSEGGVLDPHGRQDVRDAAAAGLHVGVYHFARPDLNNAAAEAAAFNGFRAGLPTDCPPCLDAETGPITRAWNDAWLADVGDNAIGYTYRSARNTLSLPDSRVWIAWPNGQRGDYLGCQYGQGPVPGVPDTVDLDWFDSSLVEASDVLDANDPIVQNILAQLSELQTRVVVTGYGGGVLLEAGTAFRLPVAPQTLFNISPQDADGATTSVKIVISNEQGAPLAEKDYAVTATQPNVHGGIPASGAFGDIAGVNGDATITNAGPGSVRIYTHG